MTVWHIEMGSSMQAQKLPNISKFFHLSLTATYNTFVEIRKVIPF